MFKQFHRAVWAAPLALMACGDLDQTVRGIDAATDLQRAACAPRDYDCRGNARRTEDALVAVAVLGNLLNGPR